MGTRGVGQETGKDRVLLNYLPTGSLFRGFCRGGLGVGCPLGTGKSRGGGKGKEGRREKREEGYYKKFFNAHRIH